MLAALAIVAYGLALHVPLLLMNPDGRYDQGAIDMVPITLGCPFALGWAALLFVAVKCASGRTDVPAVTFAAAWRHVVAIAAIFVATFLGGVGFDLVTALLLLARVAALSVLDVAVAPLSLATIAMSGVPAATLLSLTLIGVPSVAPMLWYVSRARRRPGAAASPA